MRKNGFMQLLIDITR